jgi:magnesium transporter
VIRAWSAEDGAALEVTGPEAVRLALAGRGPVWIDLDCEEPAAATELLEPLKFHPLAIEDMVKQVNRPKVDDYGDYLYVAVHSARWDDEEPPQLREIDLLIGDRVIVTYHDGASRSITALHDLLPRRPEILARGPSHLLHFILDVLVDNYFPIMDRISAELDEVEEKMFREGETVVSSGILRLKRGMAALRRIIGPQRDTVLALTRDEYRAIPADMRPYLRDVYDRLARVGDLLESYRDESASLLELHVAMASNRLNEVIKVLTVIATIMLPLTVVTGYYGMNFHFAEYEWKYGTAYALGLLALTAAATWWYLKRNRWL